MNELDSTVTAYRFEPEAGNLHPFEVVSALPDTFIGHSRAAESAVSSDGRFVYASNRGHDGIATLAVDPASGRLARVGWTNSLGRTPRFFTLDPTGSSVVVANEDSDIIAFEVDPRTGVLERGREVARTGSSVCIVFATTA